MMNECCQRPGNAKILHTQNPNVAFRVVCLYCGLTIHEQKKTFSQAGESKEGA